MKSKGKTLKGSTDWKPLRITTSKILTSDYLPTLKNTLLPQN